MESNGTFLDPQSNQGVRQKTDAPSGKYGRQGAPVRWENPRLDLRLGVGMFTQTMAEVEFSEVNVDI